MNLSEKIALDLKTHILAGRELPYPLTLEGIASHFQVSLMPVRCAVVSLIEQNLLKQGPNRRLMIPPVTNEIVRVEPPEIDSLPEMSLDRQIEDHIIHLSLLGDASFLREEATAARFGVGRTIVRRIFSQLAGSRTIEHVPRRGWRVRVFREKEMLDYLNVRESLEVLALRLARMRFDPQKLHELVAANSPDDAGHPRLDNRLHSYWISLSGNRYLQDFFAQHGIYFQTLFDRAIFDDAMLTRISGEHRSILKSLLDGRYQDAEEMLAAHIRQQRNHVAQMYQRLNETSPHAT